jgi:hypothetical protein
MKETQTLQTDFRVLSKKRGKIRKNISLKAQNI